MGANLPRLCDPNKILQLHRDLQLTAFIHFAECVIVKQHPVPELTLDLAWLHLVSAPWLGVQKVAHGH